MTKKTNQNKTQKSIKSVIWRRFPQNISEKLAVLVMKTGAISSSDRTAKVRAAPGYTTNNLLPSRSEQEVAYGTYFCEGSVV